MGGGWRNGVRDGCGTCSACGGSAGCGVGGAMEHALGVARVACVAQWSMRLVWRVWRVWRNGASAGFGAMAHALSVAQWCMH